MLNNLFRVENLIVDSMAEAVLYAQAGAHVSSLNYPPMREVKEIYGSCTNTIRWYSYPEDLGIVYQRVMVAEAPDEWPGARFEALA